MYNVKRNWNLVRNLLVITLLFATSYFLLYFAIGKPFVPLDGPCFAVVLIWVSAHIGGFLAVQIRMPALLGMLLVGLALRNLPGDILRGYPETWESKIKALGLATIMTRAGLKVDYAKAFKTSPGFIARLGTMPVVIEALAVSGILVLVFNMPYLLALTAAFLLAAISPTIIVTGMLDLQKRALGEAKGIPSIEMAAAGIDVVVGVAGFSIFIALAIPSGGDQAWAIAKGPLSVVFGLVAALLGGLAMSVTKLWRSPLVTAYALFLTAQLFMFLFYHFELGQGAGALAAIGVATVAGLLWTYGMPKFLSAGPQPLLRSSVDHLLAVLWMVVVQPLLFGSIGASVLFESIPASTVPRAIAAILVGMVCRIVTVPAISFTAGLSKKEVLFVALSWFPKATVQGALATVPLQMIEANMQGDPDYEEYYKWGQEILATAVLSIFITAPLGLVFINMLAPKLLTKDDVSNRPPRVACDSVTIAVDTQSTGDSVAVQVYETNPYFNTTPEGHMCDDDPLPMEGYARGKDSCTQTDLAFLQRHTAPPLGTLQRRSTGSSPTTQQNSFILAHNTMDECDAKRPCA